MKNFKFIKLTFCFLLIFSLIGCTNIKEINKNKQKKYISISALNYMFKNKEGYNVEPLTSLSGSIGDEENLKIIMDGIKDGLVVMKDQGAIELSYIIFNNENSNEKAFNLFKDNYRQDIDIEDEFIEKGDNYRMYVLNSKDISQKLAYVIKIDNLIIAGASDNKNTKELNNIINEVLY